MRPRRSLLVLLAAVLLLAGGLYGFVRWGRQPPLPAGLIQANGRLEGDEITVAAKFAGRVHEICAREGDAVVPGQVLARMDDAQAQARVAQASHAEAAALAQWRAARSALATLERNVPLSIDTAAAGLARARAALSKAQAGEQQSGRDAKRFRELASRGSLGTQKSEAADLAWALAVDDVEAARAAAVQAGHEVAQANLGWQRIEGQRQAVAAAGAQLEGARAVVAEFGSVLADLTIVAPAAGVITMRLSDAGEVVPAGAPLFTVVDLNRLYLKVYVPEPQIGKVRLGLPARVFTDAFPDRPFAATVRYIAARAEFTPKEVQSADERVKLVFPVKLYLDENPDRRLTPGMPADAIIQCDKETPWMPPRR
jgi:HlyD family secretion protein